MPAYASMTGNTMVVTAASPAVPLNLEDDQNLSWRLLRYVGATPITVGIPRAATFDSLEGVVAGDIVVVRDAEDEHVRGIDSVRGVHANTVTFGTESGVLDEEGVYFTFLRLTELPVDERISSIPRLQTGIDSATYITEGAEFTVADAAVSLVTTEGTDGVWAASDEDALLTSAGSDFSAVLVGWTVVLLDHDASVPCVVGRVAEVVDATSLRVSSDTTFSDGTGLSFRIYPFMYTDLEIPALTWWAEYVYRDNSETVEANFGSQVGLTKAAFDLAGGGNYLAVVRALHYALWMGPTVANLELGVQALLGLPFSEVAGTVSEINAAYSDAYTRITVLGSDGVTRAYLCPQTAGIGLNPETGIELAEGDAIDAYTALTGGVAVSDFIRDPYWYYGWLQGVNVLQKFHKFLVSVDLTAVTDTGAMALVRSFLDRLKPKHTDYILAGTINLDYDEVDVQDDIEVAGVLGFVDCLYSTPDGSLFSGALSAPSATSVTLGAEAVAINGLYVGLTLKTVFSGSVQYTEILAYSVAREVTVSGWPLGTPADGSAYSLVNPPPFPAGMATGLDYHDGRGNWDPASRSTHAPQGGSSPTAVATLSGVTGIFLPGEVVRRVRRTKPPTGRIGSTRSIFRVG